MSEEFSDDFVLGNELGEVMPDAELLHEIKLEKVSEKEKKKELLALDTDELENDGKLSTIPEETDSVAKFDDFEQKDDGELGVSKETAWPSANDLATENGAVPVNGESISSATEQLVGISEDDLDDSVSDRATYMEQYRNLMLELTMVKHRNILLQKKVLEHFKRRKMDNIGKMEDEDLDLDAKYLKQLQEFKQLKDKLHEEEQLKENEIEELRKETHFLNNSIQENLNELVAYINHTVDKVQSGKTNKTFQKEIVEHLTGRLVSKFGEFSKLQLEHIKLRNKVTAQQEKKQELEVCGEVLHLANYEQLRAENQNLLGKVEDRDEELQRLRDKAMTAVHNLAHVRQKSWTTELELKEKSSQLHDLEKQFAKMREDMSVLKKRRDHYRMETRRLKQTAGLLMEPALLRDYEQTVEETACISAELQNVRNSYYDDQCKLTNIRKMLQLMRHSDRSTSVECLQITVPCQPSIRRK